MVVSSLSVFSRPRYGGDAINISDLYPVFATWHSQTVQDASGNKAVCALKDVHAHCHNLDHVAQMEGDWMWAEVMKPEQVQRFETSYGWLAARPNKENFQCLLAGASRGGNDPEFFARISDPLVAQYGPESGDPILWPNMRVATRAYDPDVVDWDGRSDEWGSLAEVWFDETVNDPALRERFLGTAHRDHRGREQDLREKLRETDGPVFLVESRDVGGEGKREKLFLPTTEEDCWMMNAPFVARGILRLFTGKPNSDIDMDEKNRDWASCRWTSNLTSGIHISDELSSAKALERDDALEVVEDWANGANGGEGQAGECEHGEESAGVGLGGGDSTIPAGQKGVTNGPTESSTAEPVIELEQASPVGVVGPREFGNRFHAFLLDVGYGEDREDMQTEAPTGKFLDYPEVGRRERGRLAFEQTVNDFLQQRRFFRLSMYGLYLRELTQRFPEVAYASLGIQNFFALATYRRTWSWCREDLPSDIFVFTPDEVDELFSFKSDAEVARFVAPTLASTVEQRATRYSPGPGPPGEDQNVVEVFVYDKAKFNKTGELHRIQPHFLRTHDDPRHDGPEDGVVRGPVPASVSVEDLQRVIAFAHDLAFVSLVALFSRHDAGTALENKTSFLSLTKPSDENEETRSLEFWAEVIRGGDQEMEECISSVGSHSSPDVHVDSINVEKVALRHIEGMTGRKVFFEMDAADCDVPRAGINSTCCVGDGWSFTTAGQDGAVFSWLLADPEADTAAGRRNRSNLRNMFEYFRQRIGCA